MDDSVLEWEVCKEVVAEEDVVEHLRVPVEDVCVALALLKGLNQRMELEITGALQGGQRVRELKIVEVSQDDHVRVRIEGENLADEIPHHLRLGIALRLRSAHRGLETAKQGIVLGLGLPVVGDHEELLAAGSELTHQRFAHALRTRPGRIPWIDAARTDRELRSRRSTYHHRRRGRVA